MGDPTRNQTNKSERKPGDEQWLRWVEEGKQIVREMEAGENLKMRLGELAAGVVKVYGERKLEQFAKAIGKAACTLERTRSVYRAWYGEDAPKQATPPESYSVAQELQSHPDRFEIIKDKPNLTVREARRRTREYKRAQIVERPNDWWRGETERWFKNVAKHAGIVIRDTQIAATDTIDPEQRQALREIIDPELLPTLREAGEALTKLAAYLEKVISEPPDTEDDFDTAEPAEPPQPRVSRRSNPRLTA
jgi:hypothetical protein